MRALWVLLSSPLPVEPGNPPAGPFSLGGSVLSDTEVFLSWNTPTQGGPVTSFSIDRSLAGFPLQPFTGVDGSVNSLLVGGLSPATAYNFRVRAVNPDGQLASNTIQITTDATPPGQLSLSAIAGQKTVELGWAGMDAATARVDVERSIDGAPFTLIGQLTGSPPGSGLTDSDLLSGVEHCYVVSTFDSGGAPIQSSNTACATPLPPDLAAPTSVSANAVDDTRVIVQWNDGSSSENPATGFNVFNDGVLVASVGLVSTVEIGGFSEGTATGPWEVSATNATEESPAAGGDIAVTPLAAPTNGGAREVGGGTAFAFVEFTWSPNSQLATGQTLRQDGVIAGGVGPSVGVFQVDSVDAAGSWTVQANSGSVPDSAEEFLGSGPPWPQ